MNQWQRLAQQFVSGYWQVGRIYRIVIQPNSALRDFKTARNGLLFTMRGTATMHVEEAVYHLEPGTLFYATIGTKLNIHVGQEEHAYYLLQFTTADEQGSDNENLCAIDPHFLLHPGLQPLLTERLRLLHQYAQSDQLLDRLRVRELFLGAIHLALQGSMHSEEGEVADKQTINAAIAYINGCYMEEMTLDDLADTFEMKPRQFSYFFHKHTGFRPIDYVIHCRMMHASEMLRTGNYPVRDVAISVGYHNPLYFSRLFKKKFGVSPIAYRQICSQKDLACTQTEEE